MTDEDGFRRLKVHVAPAETADSRTSVILIRLKTGSIPIGEIKVIQSGVPAGN